MSAEADWESERRLAIATRAACIGVWEWDLTDHSFVYSDIARQIMGFAPDEVVTLEKLRAVTHPDDLPLTSAQARQALDPAVRLNAPYRYRIRRADGGEQRWILAYGEATFVEQEGTTRAIRYTGTIQDITDQQRAEEALADSEKRLRMAMAAGQMAVWALDAQTETLAHSPELNMLCGFPPEARPTLDEFRALYAPGERERVEREAEALCMRGETQFQTEFRQLRPDGSERWMLLRAAFASEGSGPAHRIHGVLMDVTERRQNEERVRVVARELQHRLKNALSIVQTIASQTFRNMDDPAAAVQSFTGRLRALALATDAVTRNDSSNGSILDVVREVTAPFRSDPDSFQVNGEDLRLPGKIAIGLGMALHELCTNAAKYGALSEPSGRVELRWTAQADQLHLVWQERDGPPVLPPSRHGFGTRLLERGIFLEPEGKISVEFRTEGVTATVVAQLHSLEH